MRLSVLLCACLATLVLASTASAGVGVFDITTSLAKASRNDFGDLQVKARTTLAKHAKGAALVRCTGACTYGKGWLAFTGKPALAKSGLSGAHAYRIAGPVWGVTATLSPTGLARWTAFSRRAAQAEKRNGVPDALVIAVNGTITGQPLATQIVRKGTTLRIGGFTRANALATANALR